MSDISDDSDWKREIFARSRGSRRKMYKPVYDFSDVFNKQDKEDSKEDSKDIGEGQSLGSPSPEVKSYLMEITLNYPRTSAFQNARSERQKKFYFERWNILKNFSGMERVTNSDIKFEYCKSGHVHAHCILEISVHGNYSPIGAISDFVKTWLQTLPKKHCNYKDAYMYHEYERYRSPSICVQYVSPHRPDYDKEKQRWIDYINKFQ